MNILYGGAFDPPTVAHEKIIAYLTKKFPNSHLILLPTNNFYTKRKMESGNHRLAMLQILTKSFAHSIEVSDYELQLNSYQGTYYTLQYFKHPFFVMGADALKDITKWIKASDLISENQFLVFPRDGLDIKSIIEKDPLLFAHQTHFQIMEEFEENPASSTKFRNKKIQHYVLPTIWQYIQENKLYEVNSCIRKDF